MRIFNGKKIAEEILLDLKRRIRKEKINLKLAVILVGEDPASKLFIRNKERAAKKIGIRVVLYKFKKNTKEKELVQKIKDLNNDLTANGIIVQLPLPRNFKANRIIRQISPKKDVDGFNKRSYFSPVLPSAILIAIKQAVKRPKNKKIIALVNSDIFGKTLKSFLKESGIKINYFKNRRDQKIKSADILITA